ncbi:MAG: disulfide bond formation protein B [Holosporaceae bacterium]|jgi:disulfide bond formation protein DsbB|nr:disulfide bond formation protein B [Holosporaceae bacterium]
MKELFEKMSRPQFGLPISLFILYAVFSYSFLLEYFSDYALCKLQLAQRYSVIACIILITMALLLRDRPSVYKKLVNFSCAGIFIGGAVTLCKLMFQYKIVSEAEFFQIDIPQNIAIEKLESIFQKSQMESCANINFTIFGLPDTAYILLIFVFLGVYLFCCFRISDQNSNE